MIRLSILSILLVLGFCQLSQGQEGFYRCPSCGGLHQVTATTSGPTTIGQQVAQIRANQLARQGFVNHPRNVTSWQTVPGATFEGTGMRSGRVGRDSVPTCRPGMRGGSGPGPAGRPLLGDAIAYGSRGTFRVRIWGGSGGYGRAPTQRARRLRLFR